MATVMQVAGSGAAALCGLVLLTALSGVFVREGGRGLGARVPRPGWSPRFLGSWLLCSAMLGALLIVPDVLHAWSALGPAQPLAHSVVAGGWSAVPAVLMVGLVLAATLHGVHWLLRKFVPLQPRGYDARSSVVAICGAAAGLHSSATPLRAGWSDRGPPAAALAAF